MACTAYSACSSSALERAEELPAPHDLGGRPLEPGRLRRTGRVRLVELPDEPWHPVAKTLEQPDSQPRKQVEDAAADESSQRVLPSPAVVDGIRALRPRSQRRVAVHAMDPDRHIQLLRGLKQRVEVGIVELASIRACAPQRHAREALVVLGPIPQLLDGLGDVPHGRRPDPSQPADRFRAIGAHRPVERSVERALESNVAQCAEAVGLACEHHANVDSRSIHVSQADSSGPSCTQGRSRRCGPSGSGPSIQARPPRTGRIVQAAALETGAR